MFGSFSIAISSAIIRHFSSFFYSKIHIMLQLSLLLSKTSPAYQNQKNHRDYMPKKVAKKTLRTSKDFSWEQFFSNIYLFFRISQIFQKQFVCKQYLIYYIVVHNDVFITRVLKEKIQRKHRTDILNFGRMTQAAFKIEVATKCHVLVQI